MSNESNKIMKEAGIMEITQVLTDTYAAGTNTRWELDELERHMRILLERKDMTYKDVEHYLVSIGYQIPSIRKLFKHLTGLDPYRLDSSDYMLNMPSCLPGFNYGYGLGKNNKYKYLFIMAYRDGYAVFGQVDDLKRDLLKYSLDIDECFAFLNKEAKDIKTCRNNLNITPKDISNAPENNKQFPVTQNIMWLGRTSSIAKMIESQQMQPTEIRAVLRTAYDNNEITVNEHNTLYKHFITRKAEEEMESNTELDKLLAEQSIDMATDNVPKDKAAELGQDTLNFDITNIQAALKKISNFLAETLLDSLGNTRVTICSLTFTKKDADKAIEKTPDVAGQSPKQYFNKKGIFSVVFNVDIPEYAQLGTQRALAIYAINDKDEVETNGMFKGVDDKIYPLNAAGLEEYFKTMLELEKID